MDKAEIEQLGIQDWLDAEPTARPARTPYESIRYWVEERESLRQKKEAGLPPPWTDDPILHQYRFCNVKRADDRVSRWILHHIIEPYRDHPNLWLMLAIARWVNWPPTLQELMTEQAWPTEEPDWVRMAAIVEARQARKEKTFSGAYKVNGKSDHKGTPKAQTVFRNFLGRELWLQRDRMEAVVRMGQQTPVHQFLVGLHGWGSFMAGQVVADLTWTPLLSGAEDLDTWAAKGPGSQQGLNRLAGRPVDSQISQERAVAEMITLRHRLIADLPWVTTCTLMDIQNVCCEGDKYLRVLLDGGKLKSRYRPETAY